MHKCSLFQIKTVKPERSYSYFLPTKLWKTDVQNDLCFYVTMVLLTSPHPSTANTGKICYNLTTLRGY